MKVFISWSKARSRHVAEALRDWLPCVLQNVQPFISHQDIQKGTRGMARLADELEESSVGIIVLTPENHAERWILFEAGALSKIQRAYVCTYLVAGLAPSDIPSPLGQFQHTRADREDTRAMVATINAALPDDRRLTGDRLAVVFDKWWPDLEAKLKKLPDADAEPVPKPSADAMLAEILETVRGGITASDVLAIDEQRTVLAGVQARLEASEELFIRGEVDAARIVLRETESQLALQVAMLRISPWDAGQITQRISLLNDRISESEVGPS